MNDTLNVVGEPVAWRWKQDDLTFITNWHPNKQGLRYEAIDALYTESQLQAAYAKGQDVMRERAANIAMTEANLQRDLDKVRNTTMAVVYSQDAMKWKKIAAAIRALPIEGEP